MSNDLNLCQFIGRLGQDVETKYMASGEAVANISIAVGSQWTDKATGERKEAVEWVRVVFFGKLAEIASEYLKKGAKVYVSGRWKTRKWENKDGVTMYTTELQGQNMQMLDSKPRDADGGEAREASRPAAGLPPTRASDKQHADDLASDVPFN